MAEAIGGEARRCGVSLEALGGVQLALAQLDAGRALLYGAQPGIPDAAAIFRTWEAASAALGGPDGSAARAAGWPFSLRSGGGGRLRASAAHLEAAAQLASLPAEDKPTAARWITVALAPDPQALQKRLAELPSIRDLDEA